MNAFRKFRMLALVALIAALVVGFAGTNAEAGYGCSYVPSYQHVNFNYGLQPVCYPPTPCWSQPIYWNSCHSVFPGAYLP